MEKFYACQSGDDLAILGDKETLMLLGFKEENIFEFPSDLPDPPFGRHYHKNEDGTFHLEEDIPVEPYEPPPPPPQPATEKEILEAKLKAVTDRQEFLEDCIAEMAGEIYNTY